MLVIRVVKMFLNHLKTRSKPNPIDTLIPNSLNSKLGCLMVFSRHERMRRVAKGILNFEVFMRIVAAAVSFLPGPASRTLNLAQEYILTSSLQMR